RARERRLGRRWSGQWRSDHGAGEPHRFHVYIYRRGARLRRRAGAAAVLRPVCAARLPDRAASPRRPSAVARRRPDHRDHGAGADHHGWDDQSHPSHRHQLAIRQLRRLIHADQLCDGRDATADLGQPEEPEGAMTRRHRSIIAWMGAPLGLALIGYGLLAEDTAQWRVQLLVGLWLISLLPRAAIAQRAPVAARGLSRLALVFGLGFLAVALQLAREQISQASATQERAAALLQPAAAQQPDSAATLRPADRTALGDG